MDRTTKPLADAVLAEAAADVPQGKDAEQITQRTDGDTVEARSVSRTIRTVEDLLSHIEADMTKYEVAASEATKWEGMSVDRATGQPVVTELFRVFVRLKPRPGPGVREVVEAMIAAASRDIVRPSRPKTKSVKGHRWAVLVIADPHVGKYAWARTTGQQDYDVGIAATFIREASQELLSTAASMRPSRLTVATLGDVYHYDTPSGTTTSGTPLERDGRLQKMIQVGTDELLQVVDTAGDIAPTDTLTVHGNHDETLTYAWLRILQERFRKDRRVRVEDTFTPRKYLHHAGNLLGFCHGHRAKKRLPQLMALEAAELWSQCPYREIHTGHYHQQSAEWSRPIETIDGVLVRVAPALCPPDEWHAQQGFVGNRQAMELFVYERGGGLSSMHVSGPPPGGRR